jgi:hypothetical protein
MSSKKLSQHTFEISVYNGELTPECLIKNVAKVKKSFADLDKDFFEIFSDAIKRNKFSDDRLNDAVNYVIDNCIYPKPTIAQFISYDKKVKIYTYEEVQNNVHIGDSFDNYKNIGKGKFIRKIDAELYNL